MTNIYAFRVFIGKDKYVKICTGITPVDPRPVRTERFFLSALAPARIVSVYMKCENSYTPIYDVGHLSSYMSVSSNEYASLSLSNFSDPVPDSIRDA